MKNAKFIIEKIHRLLNHLKRAFVCLSQEVNAGMKGLPWSSMDCKLDNEFDDHGPAISNSCHRRSSATYRTVHFRPCVFPTTPFSTITPSHIGMKGVAPSPLTVSDSGSYFKTHVQPLRGRFLLIVSVFRFKKQLLPCFWICELFFHCFA